MWSLLAAIASIELQTVLLVELINAAAGVNELLLAGVEGVALGADFNGDVLLGAAGGDDFAAGAADGGLFVLGVDSGLHSKFLLILGCLEYAPKGHGYKTQNAF